MRRCGLHMTAGYIQIGSPKDYDGDNPWWTLRFDAPVEDVDKDRVAAIFADALESLADCNLTWTGDDRVDVDLGDPWFDNAQQWSELYAAVARAIEMIHDNVPLHAVVFLDTDDMREAERDAIELYDRLKRARGKKRAELGATALRSGNPALERLGLSFAASLIGSDALSELAARSDLDRERVREAVAEGLRKWAFDYDKKTAALDAALLELDVDLVSKATAYWIAKAAVRNAPAMGRALAALDATNPQVFEAIATHMRADPSDKTNRIALAFAEAERGNVAQAREHLDAARLTLDTNPQTALWRETIPKWLEQLARRLE